jgi:hypothetical protein
MTCPYINPSIQQCENCPLPDCDRDEHQDDREKCKKHYYKDIEASRVYHRDYEREKYDTVKNTKKCRAFRARYPEKKKAYDHERYLQRKERQVS